MAVIRRRRVARRRPLVRKRRGMRRGMRSRLGLGRGLNANRDYATVTEVIERTVAAGEGQYITHCLQDFARATYVASQYRFYKCKKVEVEFMPYANTFAPGTSFPELYTQVDRTGGVVNGASTPIPTKGFMEAKGCLPQKWTTPIKKFYIPSVLRNENLYIQHRLVDVSNSYVNNIAAVSSTPVFNKWYMCQHYAPPLTGSQTINPTYPMQATPATDSMALQWYGMQYFADSPVAGGPSIIGKVIIKVHWQFKQPLWPPTVGITGSQTTGGEGWTYNAPNSPNVNVQVPSDHPKT